ncbi:MAG: hypothetical protein KDD44_08835, partial [Bdellovibrionales bacterium]|nr:hypothetical protein [Bdellovibrionales bacterium]
HKRNLYFEKLSQQMRELRGEDPGSIVQVTTPQDDPVEDAHARMEINGAPPPAPGVAGEAGAELDTPTAEAADFPPLEDEMDVGATELPVEHALPPAGQDVEDALIAEVLDDMVE